MQAAFTEIEQVPEVAFRGGKLLLPGPYQDEVDRYWKSTSASGKFFRGEVVVAAEMALTGATPVVEVQLSDYAHYLFAMQDNKRQFDCKAVYCATIAVSSDFHLVLGEMADHTATPGQIQCPGGGIDSRDLQSELPTVSCCKRELEEEFGSAFSSQGVIPFAIKTFGRFNHVGIFFIAHLGFDKIAALRHFEHHNQGLRRCGLEPEIRALHMVPLQDDAIDHFVTQYGSSLVDYGEELLRHQTLAIRSKAFPNAAINGR